MLTSPRLEAPARTRPDSASRKSAPSSGVSATWTCGQARTTGISSARGSPSTSTGDPVRSAQSAPRNPTLEGQREVGVERVPGVLVVRDPGDAKALLETVGNGMTGVVAVNRPGNVDGPMGVEPSRRIMSSFRPGRVGPPP